MTFCHCSIGNLMDPEVSGDHLVSLEVVPSFYLLEVEGLIHNQDLGLGICSAIGVDFHL
jgi:hypothetical protein